MPRNTFITVAATAVTLACLGASFYASPTVIAQQMGRQVDSFTPVQASSPDAERHITPPTVIDAELRTSATLKHDSAAQVSPTTTAPAPVVTQPADALDEVPETSVEPLVPGVPGVPNVPTTTESTPPTTQEPAPSPLPSVEVTLPSTPEPTEKPAPEDLDSPDSMTVIVNKQRPLPADYAPIDLVELPAELGTGPHQLREEAATATEAMFEAARQDDVTLVAVSGYRSYDYQLELYNNYARQYGVERSNQISARPGYSEHQTGLALDVDTPDGQHTLRESFGDTAAGQWLADHAPEYGFVIRYPENAEDTTGFQYEPWHLRYFGTQFSQHIAEHSGTAEVEFGLDPAPDYED